MICGLVKNQLAPAAMASPLCSGFVETIKIGKSGASRRTCRMSVGPSMLGME